MQQFPCAGQFHAARGLDFDITGQKTFKFLPAWRLWNGPARLFAVSRTDPFPGETGRLFITQRYRKDTLLPDAPENVFCRVGNGANVIYVDQDANPARADY